MFAKFFHFLPRNSTRAKSKPLTNNQTFYEFLAFNLGMQNNFGKSWWGRNLAIFSLIQIRTVAEINLL